MYNFNAKNCYIQLGPTSISKDFYLFQTIGGAFNTIRILDDETLLKDVKETELDEKGIPKPNKWTTDYVNKLKAKRDIIIDFIKVSKLYKSYDDVIVPEDWNKAFEEKEGQKISDDGENIEKLTPAEIRKLAEQTIVHTLVKQSEITKDCKPFKWQKNTLKISDLRDDCCNVYYSYGDEDTIPVATVLLWKMYGNQNISSTLGTRLNPEKIKLYRVSKSMPKKFLKNHKHINQFFKIETETSKTMANELVDWTTAKYIKDNIDQLKFMRNYKLFNQEIAELYKEVKNYSLTYYNDNYSDFTDKYTTGKTFIEGVLDYTKKVTELQLFIREHGDTEEIKQKSMELFGIDTVTESIGYNLEMYDKMQVLLNYSESIKALFNHVNVLIDIKEPDIEIETEQMIKEIIHAKDLQGFRISKVKPIEVITEEVIDDSVIEDLVSELQVEETEVVSEEI